MTVLCCPPTNPNPIPKCSNPSPTQVVYDLQLVVLEVWCLKNSRGDKGASSMEPANQPTQDETAQGAVPPTAAAIEQMQQTNQPVQDITPQVVAPTPVEAPETTVEKEAQPVAAQAPSALLLPWKKETAGCLSAVATVEEYEDILSTVPSTTTPQCLADFGYKYTAEGKLVRAVSEKPFAWLGQKHYDALGDAIISELYSVMERKYGLSRVMVPLPQTPGEQVSPQIPIFMSQNFAECNKALVIIQGSGAVRPGMWARALCINAALSMGTIFPYLEKAASEGYGVIVLNPNENRKPLPVPAEPTASVGDAGPMSVRAFWLHTSDNEWKRQVFERRRSEVYVLHNEVPEEHALYVWDTFIRPCRAKSVSIVAHSYGGRCTTSLIRRRLPEFESRVAGIAFTDAINDICRGDSKQVRAFIKNHTVNWVASSKPLDTPERTWFGCTQLSSGHAEHEWTSGSAFPSIFPYLADRIKAFFVQQQGGQGHS